MFWVSWSFSSLLELCDSHCSKIRKKKFNFTKKKIFFFLVKWKIIIICYFFREVVQTFFFMRFFHLFRALWLRGHERPSSVCRYLVRGSGLRESLPHWGRTSLDGLCYMLCHSGWCSGSVVSMRTKYYYRCRQVDIDVGLNSSSRDETFFLVYIPSFCVDFPMLRNHAH